MTAQLAESVAGMAVIQAFNRERAFQKEFDGLNEDNRLANVRVQKIYSVFFPAIELLGVIATGSVLFAGAQFIDAGTMEIGTLIAAVGLLALVFQPLQELSELYGQVQAASAAMDKISSVLDAEIDIADRPGARPIGRIDGRLELDRVTFAYGDEPVLHAIEISVPPGGCIAMVGESGGGKSTTAKLIARFYDPDEGAVRVDGTDLRDVELVGYRRQLGVVLQDPFLFSGTIADNIRFGKPDASDEEVRSTAAAVGVDRVAARLENGLEHIVREGGAGLSAGERQLISIARALLADPRILILDEATSNIDRPTEIVIERAFDRLLAGRTSIIIAHRLATVRRADEILVLEHGRIVQRGSERQLMSEDGPFRSSRARCTWTCCRRSPRKRERASGVSLARPGTACPWETGTAAAFLPERLSLASAASTPRAAAPPARSGSTGTQTVFGEGLAAGRADARRRTARRPARISRDGRSSVRPGGCWTRRSTRPGSTARPST